MLLADPAYTVPPPGPSGSMAWLRATVSRFSEGAVHARRRALVEALLTALDPTELRGAARAAARAHRAATAAHAAPGHATAEATARPAPGHASAAATVHPSTDGDARVELFDLSPNNSTVAGWDVPLPYVPVAVLAGATGVAPAHIAGAVEAVRTVAAAYHPGTDAPGADDALARLLDLLPAVEPEAAAQHVALLVQACEATAALVRGALERPLSDVLRDTPPVAATRRLAPDGEVVVVPLHGHPFGAGPRACPGEAHARALAAGVVEGAR